MDGKDNVFPVWSGEFVTSRPNDLEAKLVEAAEMQFLSLPSAPVNADHELHARQMTG